jgi:multidrug efflux pump subunit AcrB
MIMIIGAVFLSAFFSLSGLPLEKLPEIAYPQVIVETSYPGMGAAELRSAVTIPLEDALSPVKGLEGISSVSGDGSSLVILGFRWGTDPSRAATLVREAIDTVYPELPAGTGKPVVVSGDPRNEPHGIIAIRSLSGDNRFAREFADYELRARLRRLDGTGEVVIVGGEEDEALIELDLKRAAARGLRGDELARTIAAETTDLPGGNAREGDRELTIVSAGRPGSVEELSRLVLPSASGPLKLPDVAGIGREAAPRKSLFIFRDREETALEIYRRPGADPVKFSGDIRKVLDETGASGDLEIRLVYDSSSLIIREIRGLGLSALLAAAAVTVTLVLFMGSIGCSFLAVLALPFSAAAAIILLRVTGRSLNSMSLGGLAMGIGLVSDASVIILDLLRRNMVSAGEKLLPAGVGALAASVSGSGFAGTFTTAIVFLPVVFLPGPLGSLFGDLALALVASVTAGWLYAQFCLPSLFCFIFSSKRNPEKQKVNDNNRRKRLSQNFSFWESNLSFIRKSGLLTAFSEAFHKTNRVLGKARKPEKFYRLFLRKGLRRPLLLFPAVLLASAAGLVLLLTRPAQFIAPENITEIEVAADFPYGTLPEAAASRGILISGALSELPFLDLVLGRMGAEEEDTGRRADSGYRKERLLFRCVLGKNVRAEEALAGIRDKLSFLPSGEERISVSFPRDRVERLLGLSSFRTLAVKGNGREETEARAEAALAFLKREAGPALAAVEKRPSGLRPELRLIPNREAAALLGVSAVEMAGAVYAASEGMVTGSLEIDGRRLDVRLRGGAGENPFGFLETLPLPITGENTQGASGQVFLGSLNRIERRDAEAVLARQDRGDVIYLDLVPAPGGEKKTAALAADTGASAFRELPGLSRADESVFSRYRSALVLTIILVLILLYLSLGAQFESFILPFILMLSIPFSLAGAGPVLCFSGAYLDSGAVLGLVTLFGLAVNNGIILYEISGEKIRRDLAPAQAVYSGAAERFGAAMITTLTTVFALLPLAFSPLGASQRSMAAAMLGGIIASTLLSFFVLPPVFIPFLKRKSHGQ